ncbi:SDR family oxidoreductase [uncultured Amnibacterium sp.]|uniref:SDR family oxidoreductase n=1 Tax=uncultured Amnibacterium sp. TaxID=1631851 RepID=UPI0035CA83FD
MVGGPFTDGRLTGHVLLTGGTGFVGQAVLERLLVSHPDTTVSVLVRARGTQSGADRLAKLLRKPVFKPWRDRVGADEAARIYAARVHAVEGALGAVPPLPADIDVVIHSASTVSFDPPIDEAFATNVGGATSVYEALLAAGADPHVVHVSTCYVGGIRKGVLPEARLAHEVDWRAEALAAARARERVELRSREPAVLRTLMADARTRVGKEGPQAVARATEEARVEWVKRRLVQAGRSRAESLGWTDVYTLTKAFAERAAEDLWAGAGHRLSIVRPSVIESALAHPFPGWIDGFKVADPLIIAFGRGQLPDFPGVPDSVLDVVPVDYVVNAILAAAAAPPAPAEPRYVHVASGATNPLPFHRMYQNVRDYFTANPIPDTGRGAVRVPTWQFPGDRRVERALKGAEVRADLGDRVLDRLPSTSRSREWQRRLDRRRGDLAVMRSLSELYRAYVGTELIFDDTVARSLHAALPLQRQESEGFDVTRIGWEDYLQRVHFPAVTSLMRVFSRGGTEAAPPAPQAPLPERSDVLAVFDLEGTVVDSNVVEQYLWVRGAGFGGWTVLGEVAAITAALPRYLAAERRDRGEFVRAFLRRYAGLPADRLQRIVRGGYADRLLGATRPEAVARIQAHRAAGHRTVLVTGSIGTLTEPIAGLFDEVVASAMHEADGVLTGYLARPPLVDEARAAWLTQYAARNGFDLAASYGYGDSHADLPWLGLLGRPTAVNPDARLAKEAQRRRWAIAAWRERGVARAAVEGVGPRIPAS